MAQHGEGPGAAAPSAATSAAQGAPPAASDPSMEDILASIRRILSEEETENAPGAAGATVAAPHASAASDQADDVLDLEPGMLVREDERHAMDPAPAIAVSQVEPPDRGLIAQAPANEPGLIAPETAAAAALSVNALVQSLAAGRHTVTHRGGPTIEDLVREELRPLLKGWLDAHLPPLVERLVRTEIERVAGRVAP